MLWTKIKDIFTGKDRNWDGKVDIHDKMIEAEEKASANKKSKNFWIEFYLILHKLDYTF